MANNIDWFAHEQSDLDLHSLPKPVCLNKKDHYSITWRDSPHQQWFVTVASAPPPQYCQDGIRVPVIYVYEPCHEIIVLFVLRKLILLTCMRRYPVGLDVWYLVGPLVYFLTSCVWTGKIMERLCGCAGSFEPLLVAYVISTIISWAGSYALHKEIFTINNAW